ncbi:MAG: 2-C-methyl-D-erythritol 4-phosphate cytidylyltransferase [Flavobacteriales bacterium]
MKKTVIIVAGGSGSRMLTDVPKQFLLLDGLPVMMHSIQAFVKYDPQIELVVVLPEHQINFWEKLISEYNFHHPQAIAIGGATRFHSVKNGLQKATGDIVAVHDAVRPLVSKSTIERVFNKAAETGAAIPAMKVTETVRMVTSDTESKTLQRDQLRSIQTPQTFRRELMMDAFGIAYQDLFTDCASVVEYAGHKVALVEGNPENIKITIAQDLHIASLLLQQMRLQA